MNPKHQEVIDRFSNAFAERNVPAAMAVFHPEATYEDFGARHLCKGIPEITAFWNLFFQNIGPDDFVAQRDTLFFSEDGHYAVEWTMQFRLTGRFGDVEGTGQKVRFRTASVGRIVDSRIVFQRDYWDTGTVMQQLKG